MERALPMSAVIDRGCAWPDRSPAHREVVRRDATPAGLAGSGLAARFRHWRGRSGRRYLFSVFPVADTASLAACPRFEDAVVLAVGGSRDGAPRILLVAQTGALPDMVFDGMALRTAVEAGADEIHVHLLASSPAARNALITDLAA